MEEKKEDEKEREVLDFLKSYWPIIISLCIAVLGIGLAFPMILNNYADYWKGEKLYFLSGWFYACTAFATFIVILITALFAAQQLRLLRLSFQASSYSQIYSRLDTINYLLVENLQENLPRFKREESSFTCEDFAFSTPERHLVGMLFTLFENVYYQWHKFRVLDDVDWNAWKLSIEETLKVPYVRAYWEGNGSGTTGRSSYTPEFQDVIQKILKESDTPPGSR